MKTISVWAKNNVVFARVLIFFIHILLILLAYYISENTHFKFSFTELKVIICCIALIVFVYPYAAKKSYVIQKILNFITASCFFLIICFFIKHDFTLPYFQNTLNAVFISSGEKAKNPTAQQILESLKHRDKSTLTKNEKHILKKEFGKQLTVFNKSMSKHDTSASSKALLILLAIIAAAGLLVVLSLLVCAISCGGAGSLLIIVFILGIGGFAFALFKIMQSLSHYQNKKTTHANTVVVP